MKYFLFLLFTFLLSISMNAQNRIKFEYDSAGNQTKRYVCLNCSAKTTNDSLQENFKDIAEIKDVDLLKFSLEDLISYYPNPVKEELYVKWELINENKITKFESIKLTS